MDSNSNQPKSGHSYMPTITGIAEKSRIESNSSLFERRKNSSVDTRIPVEVITEAGTSMAGMIIISITPIFQVKA